MNKMLLAFTAILFVAIATACGASESIRDGANPSSPESRQQQSSLPQHRVASNTSLAPKDGRRIELHVNNTDLTKAECRALIDAYQSEAGPRGQVSVRKPNANGQLRPWCVNNMDAEGTTFNDFHFE